MRDLVKVTIAFYVLLRNGSIWGPKQKTATGLLFTESKNITLTGVEHIKHKRKK